MKTLRILLVGLFLMTGALAKAQVSVSVNMNIGTPAPVPAVWVPTTHVEARYYYMPEINGLEISEKLKQNGKNIPIVLMSGSFIKNNEKENFTKFIKKPFRPNEFINMLNEITGGNNVKN